MQQYPVHENLNPASRKTVPFLLLVQSPLLDELGTRLVVPLYYKELSPGPLIERLHLILEIDGTICVAAIHHLSAIPKKDIGQLRGLIEQLHQPITSALDLLFQGY